MSEAVQNLPSYLNVYLAEQNYERYTPLDHAAWRFIMRQNRQFFQDHAVAVYIDGLAKTGIPTDRIPRIEEMDGCLAEYGWGAVCVNGFIPPAAFLDFQARGVLPIATDMRTFEHLAYTPAPDIVHEAAGHAPIIADEGYRAYLKEYATMARKAIMSHEDVAVYEAIRFLSDVKEDPGISPKVVAEAEAKLADVMSHISFVSEAARVARMNWWTVEYGLSGSLDSPKIFGAGLLSSVAESQSCLGDSVRKIPLSIECTKQSYDITKPQPQLYVAHDMEHLIEVLREFEPYLSYRIGGIHGLDEAQKSKAVNTVVLNDDLSLTGFLKAFSKGIGGQPQHFVVEEGLQFSSRGKALLDKGDIRVSRIIAALDGWDKLATQTDPRRISGADLRTTGLVSGDTVEMRSPQGLRLSGRFERPVRLPEGGLAGLEFTSVSVVGNEGVLHGKDDGPLFLALGTKVTSVHAGPGDRIAYGSFAVGKAQTTPGRKTPHTSDEVRLFKRLSDLKQLREKDFWSEAEVSSFDKIGQDIALDSSPVWLQALEFVEIAAAKMDRVERATLVKVQEKLDRDRAGQAEPMRGLIQQGINLTLGKGSELGLEHAG